MKNLDIPYQGRKRNLIFLSIVIHAMSIYGHILEYLFGVICLPLVYYLFGMSVAPE